MPSPKNYPKINPILDKEHAVIFRALDNFYNACEKHWKTENDMYKIGAHRMPDDHKPVSKEWKVHESQHKQLLAKIAGMREEIRHHIETQDVPHFHWTHN